MRIAQINVTSNLSTGRIANELCRICNENGNQTLLCYARGPKPLNQVSYRLGSGSLRNKAEGSMAVYYSRKMINHIRTAIHKPPLKPLRHRIVQSSQNEKANNSVLRNRINTNLHVITTRLFDRPGFVKTPFIVRQTLKLVENLESFKPDVIHLHNIHGYYLYLPVLFEYLKQSQIPVVWTLHDCWSYTGHCAYYSMVKADSLDETGCTRWKNGCYHCPQIHNYPSSWFVDNSKNNWEEKKALFTGLPYLIPVVPSTWLFNEAAESFWKPYLSRMQVIPSGIDLKQFHAIENGEIVFEILKKYGVNFTEQRFLLLSVAAVWEKRKGIEDLIELSQKLGKNYHIVCIGLDDSQINAVPKNTITALPRTESVDELCAFYTAADLYISASYEETQGMTLVEALACGTQVLCYQATALPEVVTEAVGCTVAVGNIEALADAAVDMCDNPKSSDACLRRAQQYDASRCFRRYLELYQSMYRYSPHYRESESV